MGPCQVQPRVGRGDKNEDIEWMLKEFTSDESMSVFKVKYDKLDAADKKELEEIFQGEDLEEWLNEEMTIDSAMS